MSELDDLYQEVILDHNRSPRNFGARPDAGQRAEGFNPLCGDHLWVYLDSEGGRLARVGFEGAGCAISKASASIMTDAVAGRTVTEALDLFEIFHRMVTGQPITEVQRERLGKLAAFSGVSDYPARVKCASLAWHALKAAIDGAGQAISTE